MRGTTPPLSELRMTAATRLGTRGAPSAEMILLFASLMVQGTFHVVYVILDDLGTCSPEL